MSLLAIMMILWGVDRPTLALAKPEGGSHSQRLAALGDWGLSVNVAPRGEAH